MINVAIDGPAGAGKTTVSKIVAEQLGFIYFDTGALYRALAYHMKQLGMDTRETERVIPELENIKLTLVHDNNEQRVILNGEDVTAFIRTPEISRSASDISAIPEVRQYLINVQRDFAANNDTVMEGRDIGTVIIPDAAIKIYLDAQPEERAKRRYIQLTGSGDKTTYNDVLNALIARDYNDSHREIAPLKMADDAILIDGTKLSIADIVDKIVTMVKTHKKEGQNT